MPQVPPLCVRLPPDLDAAVRERAAREGLSVSEIFRALMSQWVYQQTPSVDEGYYNARQLAMKLAHEAVSNVIANEPGAFDVATIQQAHGIITHALEQMPATYEEAIALGY